MRTARRVGGPLPAIAAGAALVFAFAGGMACGGDRSGDGRAGHRDGGGPPLATRDAAMSDAQGPNDPGGFIPPSLDGGRPLGMNPDALFGVMRPNGPPSSARIVVWAMNVERRPVNAAHATAGGAIAASDRGGFIAIDEVYGDGEADVFVVAPGYTRGHVRVPIRDGEVSHAVVLLAPVATRTLDELERAVSLDADEETGLRLELDADSFALPWGAVARGAGAVQYAVVNEAAEAGVVPGSMRAIVEDGGARVRLRGRAFFELRASHRATQLALARPVHFELPLLPDHAAGSDAGAGAARGLFWFDPQQGAFVRRGEIREQAGGARGAIDRVGFWAIGEADPSRQIACQRVRVQDEAGAPVANAAVLVHNASLIDAAHLITGDDGTACWAIEPVSTVRAVAFGTAASGPATAFADDLPITADAPGACGGDSSACAEPPPIALAPLAQTCVRGRVENTSQSLSWSASDAGGEVLEAGSAEPGEAGAFCTAVPAGSTLLFTGPSLDCGEAQSAPVTAGICGMTECADLGAIRCCRTADLCHDELDDDCDGAIDEGCVCGGTHCTLSGDRCCTSDGRCGVHSPHTVHCVQPSQIGSEDAECPDETVPVQGGTTIPVVGCCRPDNQCGLMDSQFGCVPRAEAADLWLLSATLAEVTCSF